MFVDFILNQKGHGEVGQQMEQCRFDPGMRRPYMDTKGRLCVTINTGRTEYDQALQRYVPVVEKHEVKNLRAQGIEIPVGNATALRKGEWLQLDSVVQKAARSRLRAWADLAATSSFGGFDGMSKMVLESETMSDPGEAVVDFDGMTEGRNFAPQFQLEGVPLPITHADFWISSRKLAMSRNTGTPLDTTLGEAAGRRVAEMIEKTTLGIVTGETYGGNSTQTGGYGRSSAVYGYMNFPARLTKTNLTVPTGANPEAFVNDVLAMRDELYNINMYGPFMIYHSTDWDRYLDNDYARLGGDNASMTLRQRIKNIEGIQDVRRLDYLTPANSAPFTILMVQMTSDTAQAVIGMDITTVQWESHGGMRLNFKVMCIQVPRLRADFYGKSGIMHARAA